MIFVYTEKDYLCVHRMELEKTIDMVVAEAVKEFGSPLSIDKGDLSTRISYEDDFCVYVTGM